jgi:hypothetical protein
MSLAQPSLLEQARAIAEASRPGPRCTLLKVLNTSPQADQIREVVRDHSIPQAAAGQVLQQFGVNAQMVGHHRLGKCQSCRSAGCDW